MHEHEHGQSNHRKLYSNGNECIEYATAIHLSDGSGVAVCVCAPFIIYRYAFQATFNRLM